MPANPYLFSMLRGYLIFLFTLSFSFIAGQGLSISEDADGIIIYEDKDTVLYYQLSTKSKDGIAPRANYIHPLYNLRGNIITEDFPADHLHHRGVFWAWHQVVVDGQPVMDTWDCSNISWRSRLVDQYQSTVDGSLNFTINSEWYTTEPNDAYEAYPLLQEHSTVTIYPTNKGLRIIDIGIYLHAEVDNLSIGGSLDEKGYGGFSARIKMPSDLHFISGDEKVQPKNNQVVAKRWMRFHGSFDPDYPPSGMVIIQHPNNPGSVNSWILRSSGSMQNAVFPGNSLYPIGRIEPTTLKYRIILYDGWLDEDEIEQHSAF